MASSTDNLPNLKISVDNLNDRDDVVQLEDSDQDDASMISEDVVESKVEVKLNLDTLTSNNQRNYKNPQSDVIEGEDLEKVQKKLQGRASRFGLEDDEIVKRFGQITDDDIKQLYESLKVNECDSKTRLNAVHVRGVEEMSTEDVFSYFNKCFPVSVEWINDVSCNALWNKEEDAAKAMLVLSARIIKQPKNSDKSEVTKTDEPEDDKREVEMDNVVVMANDEGEEHFDFEMESTDKPTINDSIKESEVMVPIPPGLWRLGIPHEKSKAILLRFAYKDDRKIRGAEKMSDYYKKYGNPNFNGLPGIISSSRKRKIRSGVKLVNSEKTFERDEPDDAAQIDDKSNSSQSDDSHHEDDPSDEIATRGMLKIPCQKMYADIEEEKRQRNRRKRIAVTAVQEEDSDGGEDDLRIVLRNKRLKGSAFTRLSDRVDVDSDSLQNFHRSNSTDLRSKLGVKSRCHRSTFRYDEDSSVSEESD